LLYPWCVFQGTARWMESLCALKGGRGWLTLNSLSSLGMVSPAISARPSPRWWSSTTDVSRRLRASQGVSGRLRASQGVSKVSDRNHRCCLVVVSQPVSPRFPGDPIRPPPPRGRPRPLLPDPRGFRERLYGAERQLLPLREIPHGQRPSEG